jgi:hypothetical protein
VSDARDEVEGRRFMTGCMVALGFVVVMFAVGFVVVWLLTR